jgi:hypothetical protein
MAESTRCILTGDSHAGHYICCRHVNVDFGSNLPLFDNMGLASVP